MSDPYLAPVYVDPFDEGVSFAKERPDLMTASLLAQPAELMAPAMGYSVRDWMQFRKGALSVLMECTRRQGYTTAKPQGHKATSPLGTPE